MNDRQFIMSELTQHGMTQTELAKRLGTSQSALSNKLSRNSLTIADYRKIAECLGLKFEYSFVDNK